MMITTKVMIMIITIAIILERIIIVMVIMITMILLIRRNGVCVGVGVYICSIYEYIFTSMYLNKYKKVYVM